MNKGMKYNLLKLLEQYKVEIPILQRDFAQGRNGQEVVRENFLNSLDSFLNCASENTERLNLLTLNQQYKYSIKNIDFIYGYKENSKFLPIDGQQRLTALWLLHLYFVKKLENKSAIAYLRNFTYATRKTAKRFCKELLHFDFKNNQSPSIELRQNGTMNGIIKQNDPTVFSMLTMLDSIDRFFLDANPAHCLSRLNNVQFDLIDMGEYQLSEELYIKMNSRGKQLSAFENFKSWIQLDAKVEQDMELLASIDNNWINYFWKKDKDSWEQRIFKFMSYLAIFFALNKNKSKKRSDILLDFIFLHLSSTSLTFNERNFEINGERIFQYDELKLIDNIFSFMIELEENKSVSALSKYTFLNSNNKLVDTLLVPKLFSLFFYVKEKGKLANYDDWYNLTNHIIDNTRSKDSIEHILSFFNLLEELSSNCSDIIAFFARKPKIVSRYGEKRIEEEKIKAELIMSDGRGGKWESLLESTQNNDYFNGWIDFILNYSIDSDSNYDVHKFERYGGVLCKLFKESFIKKNLKLIQRVLLSFGDYSIPNKSNQYFYLGSDSKDLQLGKEQWDKIFTQHRKYVVNFLDELLRFSIPSDSDLIKALNMIISDNLAKDWHINDWWRYVLVKYDNVLDACTEQRFYRFNTEEIFLIRGKRLQRYGKNLLAYGLQFYLYEKNFDAITEFREDTYSEPVFKVGTITVKATHFSGSKIILKKPGISAISMSFFEDDVFAYDTILDYYEEIAKQISALQSM